MRPINFISILVLITVLSACAQQKSSRQPSEIDPAYLEQLQATMQIEPKPAGFEPYAEKIPGTDINIDMVAVPGGTFQMGRIDRFADSHPHEGPSQTVKVDPFWMGQVEVTWEQYSQFVGEMVDRLEGELDPEVMKKYGVTMDVISVPSPPYLDEAYGMPKVGHPAVSMTHFAAIEYAKWLTVKTGNFYRLPTEAEWEFACRGGTVLDTYVPAGELDNYEYHRGNSGQQYGPVASKKANPFGLHEMMGNVAEWTMDQYHDDYHDRLDEFRADGGAADNPLFMPDDLYPRSVRGGSWQDDSSEIRCTKRRGSTREWSRSDPQIPRSVWWHTNLPFVGFRLVRPLETPPTEEIIKFWIDPKLDF